MSALKAKNIENLLISNSTKKERNKILQSCEPIEIVFGDVLCESGQDFSHVYFPLTGLISMVKTVDNHSAMQIALIGNEGMLGEKLLLGIHNCQLKGVVSRTGLALRMTVEQFIIILDDCPNFENTIKRYINVLIENLSQSIVCSRFHEVNARLARWLLLTHDRTTGDQFHHTHNYLSEMLGVQRSAVTIAAGSFQKKKLISYVRGDIKILDRKGLEVESCICYEAEVDDYMKVYN